MDLRPDLKHWGGGRPALKKFLADLEKELMRVGGQLECTYLEEYSMMAMVKLAFDYDKVVLAPLGQQECYSMLETDLLRPVCDHILQKTNLWMMHDLIVLSCHRKLDEHKFKISFHVFFTDVIIVANQISVLADQLDLPTAVDRSPWTGNKRRLFRLVGACKEGETAYMQPMSMASNRSIHPLHDHILTFTKGSEYDLTALPSPSSAPTELAATQRLDRTLLRLGLKLKMRTSTDQWPCRRSADQACGVVTPWVDSKGRTCMLLRLTPGARARTLLAITHPIGFTWSSLHVCSR